MPVKIIVYDAESLGTINDITEYHSEIACSDKSAKSQIMYAAEWLKKAIVDKKIII